jgi:CheY-like chemotaxis protein
MLRILHLEDGKEDALLIEESVRNEGIQVEFLLVTSRSEFDRALEQAHFDIVLADSGLPGFNGPTALKMVRQKYPHVTFVCLSGNSEPSNIKANFDMGASEFISKNNLPRLMDTLRSERDYYK